MKATKKPVIIECFIYDGDIKNSKGEYYVGRENRGVEGTHEV